MGGDGRLFVAQGGVGFVVFRKAVVDGGDGLVVGLLLGAFGFLSFAQGGFVFVGQGLGKGGVEAGGAVVQAAVVVLLAAVEVGSAGGELGAGSGGQAGGEVGGFGGGFPKSGFFYADVVLCGICGFRCLFPPFRRFAPPSPASGGRVLFGCSLRYLFFVCK